MSLQWALWGKRHVDIQGDNVFGYMFSTIMTMKNKMYTIQTNLCIQLSYLEDQFLKFYKMQDTILDTKAIYMSKIITKMGNYGSAHSIIKSNSDLIGIQGLF